MRPTSVSVVLLLVCASPAAAQDCLGFAPYSGRPLHFFVRGAFDNSSSIYGGGLSVGGSAAFGELNVEGRSLDGHTGSSFTVGGGGGLRLPLSHDGTVHLCPIAQVAFLLGPNNDYNYDFGPLFGYSLHYRETDWTFGGAFGFSANGATHQVRINPTLSYAHTLAYDHINTETGVSLNSHSRSLETLTVGVGLLIGREVSITPTLSHVSGGGGSSLLVGMRVAFAIRGVRSAYVSKRSTSCAGLASTDSTIYDTTQVAERPVIHIAPEVVYPPMERELLIYGRVILGVVVGFDGVPDTNAVTVLRSVDPGIDREALRWISGVSYWPACREGRPVRARIAQPLDFCLGGCPRGKS